MTLRCQSFAARNWLSARPVASALLMGTPAVEARSSGPGRGLGLFTARSISAFSEILTDAPAIVMKPSDDLPQLFDQFLTLPGDKQEQFLALTYRDDPERDAVLFNRLVQRGVDPADIPRRIQVGHVMQNNAFSVDMGDGKGRTHRALFLNVARINHSCAPNAHVCFYPPCASDSRGRMVIHALRNLQAGEEVLIAYFSILSPESERQANSKKWGFKCECQVCDLSLPGHIEAERERKAINDFTAQMTLLMHSDRAHLKSIRDLVNVGTKLMAHNANDPTLYPACPDLLDGLAMLHAKMLLLQKKEMGREGVLMYLEEAAIWDARLTGVESPATRKRLDKLAQFAVKKDLKRTPSMWRRDGNEFEIRWMEG